MVAPVTIPPGTHDRYLHKHTEHLNDHVTQQMHDCSNVAMDITVLLE